MNINQEQIKQLIETLEFYRAGRNYEWDGCHCHGQYIREEHGEKAEECIKFLKPLTYCNECGELIFDDGTCTDRTCKKYDWDKHTP